KLAVHRLRHELDAVGLSNPGAERTGVLARLWSVAYRKGFGEHGAVEAVDGNWRRPRTGVCHPLAPEELIAQRRHDDGGKPRAQTRGGRSGASVMADSSATREQPVVGSIADQKNVRWRRLAAEMRPAFRHDRPHAGLLDRREYRPGDAGCVVDMDRAEPDVD